MGAAFAWSCRPGLAVSWGAIAIAMVAAGPVPAQTRGGTFAVSAIVIPSTRVDVLWAASVLEVTPDDVIRGYVDVRDAARLRVTSTSRAGFRVDVHPRIPLFRAIEVRVDGLRARIGPDGGTLVAAGRSGRQVPARIDYRFELAAGVAPGRYPWPVALQVSPF